MNESAAQQLRNKMPVADKLAYFDHAAVAPLTAPAAAAIADYAQEAATQGDLPWPKWALAVERLRTVAAEFLGADLDEIALVNNTTQAIGLVAEGFPWQAGDNVVVPDNEFPSNSLPWAILARRGVELRRVPIAPSGVLDLSQLSRAIDARTRIVSVSWVGFVSGYRIDVGEVAELVHSRGALFMLDAIQGLGAFKIDVHATGVDFLAADGHKWMLGPEGAGLFYLRREHLGLLQPFGVGWNSLAGGSFDPNSLQLKATAARYEGGSTNMAGMLGFHESLRLLHQLHRDGVGDSANESSPIAQAVLTGTGRLAERLKQQGFRPHFPEDPQRRSGILGISWPSGAGSDSDVPESVALEARKYCIAAGVVLSVRGGRLRASTHAYTNDQDIERLVDSLVHFRKTFSG
ncbi:MAG: aminotransferase class V-fold PLP-dependent enzyme [Aureliella sp.]